MSMQAPATSSYGNTAGPAHPNIFTPSPFDLLGTAAAAFNGSSVASFAMSYGRSFAEQHASQVQQNLERYMGASRLKYYFFVDTSYVLSKIGTILFPFAHKDWRTKFNSSNPVAPRFDVNAPDLYIPLMSFPTYLVLVGLKLGFANEFSPEKLGAQGSSTLVLLVCEVMLCLVVHYLANVQSDLRMFDILAFCGYKFVLVCLLQLVAMVGFSSLVHYLVLGYSCIALMFFLTRTLKYQLLRHVVDDHFTGAGHKRRGSFIVLFAIVQALIVILLAR